MFLKISKLAKVMKLNYNSFGLQVINENGVLIIKGKNFACRFDGEVVPKEVLGELIKLIGKLPCPGEAFNYSPGGAQVINYLPDERLLAEPEKYWTETMLRISSEYRDYRIFEDYQYGKHAVATYLLELIDKKEIKKQEEAGETIYQCYSEDGILDCVMWSDGDTTLLIETIEEGGNESIDNFLDVIKPFKCPVE